MAFHAILLTTTALVLLAPAVALAQNTETADKWSGHLEAEGKWGTQRSLGEVGAFIPVWQNDTTLVFGDIRGKLDDQDSQEGNFGLGLRHQINPAWALGAYGFYDRRRTDTNNVFNQATFGVEALSENLEFRANTYIPESDTKSVAGFGGGTTSIGQATGGNLQLITTTTGALEERALPGFDAEAGYKVDLPDNWDVWVYAGGYHFGADGYDDVTGPRGRIEVNYNNVPYLGDGSRFTVGVESQTDDVRGAQHFGIARLRIPLNFSDNVHQPSLSALDQRMTTRVVRDVDIVAGASRGPSSSVTETATATLASGTQVSGYTVIDATNVITTAVDNAGDNALIVLDGSAGTINTGTNIETRTGQTIMGGGSTIAVTTASGKSGTVTLPGTRGTVNQTTAGNVAFLLENDDNVTLKGFNITGGQTGILNNVNVANNLRYEGLNISGQTQGGIEFISATNVVLKDLVLSNTTVHGIAFYGTVTNINFDNVAISNAATGVLFFSVTFINNPSGRVTTTNISVNPCSAPGVVNNSTLLVNGTPCP